MAKAGIQRFIIIDQVTGPGGWRFKESSLRQPAATNLYRKIFDGLGISLLPGYECIKCTHDEFKAGYDYELGIDVILNFTSGMSATLQEKYLFTKYKTVTVEYMQDWRTGEQGDWFNMKAQYYFVGYDRREEYNFQDWILLDWAAVMMETSRGNIVWYTRPNARDGARANFRYAPFTNFPDNCIIAEQEPDILRHSFLLTGTT